MGNDRGDIGGDETWGRFFSKNQLKGSKRSNYWSKNDQKTVI